MTSIAWRKHLDRESRPQNAQALQDSDGRKGVGLLIGHPHLQDGFPEHAGKRKPRRDRTGRWTDQQRQVSGREFAGLL